MNYIISKTNIVWFGLLVATIGIMFVLFNATSNNTTRSVVFNTDTTLENRTATPEKEIVQSHSRTVLVNFQHNDGGRLVAGYSSSTSVNDCAPRAIAIATQMPYDKVYQDLQQITHQKRAQDKATYTIQCCDNGTYIGVVEQYMAQHNWKYHTSNLSLLEYSPELYTGDVIVHFNAHIFAIRNGVVYDTQSVFTSDLFALDRDLNPEMRITGYFKKS